MRAYNKWGQDARTSMVGYFRRGQKIQRGGNIGSMNSAPDYVLQEGPEDTLVFSKAVRSSPIKGTQHHRVVQWCLSLGGWDEE